MNVNNNNNSNKNKKKLSKLWFTEGVLKIIDSNRLLRFIITKLHIYRIWITSLWFYCLENSFRLVLEDTLKDTGGEVYIGKKYSIPGSMSAVLCVCQGFTAGCFSPHSPCPSSFWSSLQVAFQVTKGQGGPWRQSAPPRRFWHILRKTLVRRPSSMQSSSMCFSQALQKGRIWITTVDL